MTNNNMKLLLYYFPLLLLLFTLLLQSTEAHKHGKHKHRQNYSVHKRVWAGKTLKIMTFNTWNTGVNIYNGTEKMAKHILINDPDIVGLQVRFTVLSLEIIF